MPLRCRRRIARTAATRFLFGGLMVFFACSAVGTCSPVCAADVPHGNLTVTRPRPPAVPSPLLPGAPIPYSASPLLTPLDLSIVDGRTRFLAPGPAQDRCPGDSIVFVPGVLNPFRPTAPGDGAYMCQGDAVTEGFSAR